MNTSTKLSSVLGPVALGLALAFTQASDAHSRSLGKIVLGSAVAALTASAVHSAIKHVPSPGDTGSSGSGSSPAAHQPASGVCAAQLPGGRAPTFANPKLAEGLQVICYEEYTLGYSPKTRTALWSAEYLTAERVALAKKLPRANTFHEEASIAPEMRSTLKDFVHSGYDRGHLSPNKDFSSPRSQNECFSLANMVPQNPENNQHTWEGIESGTRKFATSNGSVYIITGPLFNGAKIKFLKDRVAIPSQLFKVLFDPVHKTGGVFLVDNIDTKVIEWKSIAEFEKLSGYQFGLGSPPLMAMPAPKQHY